MSKIKSFKQFSKEKKKYADFVNSHGSHAQEKNKKETVKESLLKKLFAKDLHDYASNNSLDHHDEYGSSIDSDVMDKLHELHPMSEHEHVKNAIHHYTMDSKGLNHALIKAHKNGEPAPKHVGDINVDHLDSSFQASKHKLHTYSGAGFDIRDTKPAGKSKNGKTVYHSPGYISSSHDVFQSAKFANISHKNMEKGKNRQVMHIETPPGHKISVIGKHSSYNPEEMETLHPRNSLYEHVKTTTHKDYHGNLVDVHHLRRIHPEEME